jgi:Trypsin-co-occurring domain 1
MDSVPARVGRTMVLFETTDTTVPDSVLEADEYGTSETSSKLKDAYTQLKELLEDVSDDLGRALAERGGDGLSSVSVEFGLAFTGEANVWVLKAGGEGSVTATLTWNLDRRP